jgi:hypothetical protein
LIPDHEFGAWLQHSCRNPHSGRGDWGSIQDRRHRGTNSESLELEAGELNRVNVIRPGLSAKLIRGADIPGHVTLSPAPPADHLTESVVVFPLVPVMAKILPSDAEGESTSARIGTPALRLH